MGIGELTSREKLAKEMSSLGYAERGFSLLHQRPHHESPPSPLSPLLD
jgi:hypothetical protein